VSAGFVLFAVIVAAGPPLLDLADLGWPTWVVPVVAATAGAALARDADGELRRLVRAGADRGGFVLITGRAAAGKTRSAFGAVQAIVPRWSLYLPGRAADLNALAENGVRPARTVVWLDETQRFLGEGNLAPATVRFLLADPRRPVLIRPTSSGPSGSWVPRPAIRRR
jgi:hypothetical protein